MRILSVRDHSENELRRKLSAYMSKPTMSRASGKYRYDAVQDDADDEQETTINMPTSSGDALFTPSEIDATVEYCKAHGWLDDSRFAQCYIRGRSQKGYGPQRIKAELMQKGLDRTVMTIALDECDIDWFALAYHTAERKWGTPFPSDWKEKAKLQRYLLTRGFSHEEIQSIYANFSY